MPLKSPVLSSINKELNLAITPSKDSLAKFISSSVASSLLNTSSALLINQGKSLLEEDVEGFNVGEYYKDAKDG